MAALSKIYTTKEINKIRDELIAKYGNNCAICKKPRSAFKKNLSVDHRHSDGLIRGLLCYYCNRRLVGQFTLRKILPVMLYLLKYEEIEEIWTKYGNLLLALMETMRSPTSEMLGAPTGQLKAKKGSKRTKAKS